MKIRPPSPPASPSSFPPFTPHVTLASAPADSDSDSDPDPDKAATRRDALRAAIPPAQPAVPVRFKSLEVGDRYFTSVYVAVRSPPGSPLETLRDRLRAALGASAAVPPVAHLSLYYIDEADTGERERTARRLRSELRVLESGRDEARAVGLACFGDEGGGERDPELLEGFVGEEIWMVRCEGPVEGWEVMEKFPLAK